MRQIRNTHTFAFASPTGPAIHHGIHLLYTSGILVIIPALELLLYGLTWWGFLTRDDADDPQSMTVELTVWATRIIKIVAIAFASTWVIVGVLSLLNDQPASLSTFPGNCASAFEILGIIVPRGHLGLIVLTITLFIAQKLRKLWANETKPSHKDGGTPVKLHSSTARTLSAFIFFAARIGLGYLWYRSRPTEESLGSYLYGIENLFRFLHDHLIAPIKNPATLWAHTATYLLVVALIGVGIVLAVYIMIAMINGSDGYSGGGGGGGSSSSSSSSGKASEPRTTLKVDHLFYKEELTAHKGWFTEELRDDNSFWQLPRGEIERGPFGDVTGVTIDGKKGEVKTPLFGSGKDVYIDGEYYGHIDDEK
ncbi:MAG: hypothetical protein E7A62_06300 [Actinomycetaceae bacterium]|nr:hypothetical protein [Actinomycetaceae bacterium]MDU0970591.1 hypothetical protein [Actinomycetaceae bacterium]